MTAAAVQAPPGGAGQSPPGGVSAAAVLTALQGHYRRPGVARDGEILIPEVQAPGSSRRADLVRVGMWASRGPGVDVHEIKVSRADWRRELDDPAKAEAWWPYCNRFWVVAPPGVVPERELPEGWGLMELPAAGRRLKARVPAATRAGIQLTVPLLVELLRRADNQRLAEIDALQARHRDDVRDLEARWRARNAKDGLPRELRERLELLDELEAATGMRLARYPDRHEDPPRQATPDELAACLADARDHVTVQRLAAGLARQEDRLRRAAEAVLQSLDPPQDARPPA
jgi:hypothetical protein